MINPIDPGRLRIDDALHKQDRRERRRRRREHRQDEEEVQAVDEVHETEDEAKLDLVA